jgi:hypothetical protein
VRRAHKLGTYVTSQDNWKLVKIYRERASGTTTDREELHEALTGPARTASTCCWSTG